MLEHVSETVQLDGPAALPVYGKAYDLEPPAPLADIHHFTKGHPIEAYAAMRSKAPVCWVPEIYRSHSNGPGFWAITRYHDVRAVELDTQTFSSQRGGINMSYGAPETRHPLLYPATLNNMISMDQPHHLPLRREHMAYFTPAYVKTLQRKVDDEIDRLLDAMADNGPDLDLVDHFSAKLPLFTLCEILGVPESDRSRFIGWMHELENAADTMSKNDIGDIDPALLMRFMTGIQEMFDYGRDILKERRASPREDLLSAIAAAKIDGEYLSDLYLDGSWLLIVFAGNDTTRNSLSGTMRLLTENPGQRTKLIENPDLTPGMVDEAIRLVSPVIHMRRTATRDAEVAGQKIAEGEKVILWYGAANRDESVFQDPDRFDIERANAKDHIAFGLGPHVCLGQRVANMQLEAAYRKILARFPKIEWTGGIEMAPNNFVHAISKLEVHLGA